VCYLYPAEAVFLAECRATGKMIMRGRHPAAQIVAVTQSAKGPRLAFLPSSLASIVKRSLVLFQTTVDVAERKVEIAPQMVDRREFADEPSRIGDRFRRLQFRQGGLMLVGYAHHRSQSKPRAAERNIVRRALYCLTIGDTRISDSTHVE